MTTPNTQRWFPYMKPTVGTGPHFGKRYAMKRGVGQDWNSHSAIISSENYFHHAGHSCSLCLTFFSSKFPSKSSFAPTPYLHHYNRPVLFRVLQIDNFIRNAHSQVSYHIPDNLVGSLFYLHSRYESLTFFQSPLFTPNQSLAPPSRIAPRSNTLFSIFQHRVSTKSLVPSSHRGNALETTKISKSVFATGTGLRYSFAVVK